MARATVTDRRPLASIEEVAVYLGVPVQTLYNWRAQKKGPRSARIGRHVRYRWSDVDSFVDDSTDDSTDGGRR